MRRLIGLIYFALVVSIRAQSVFVPRELKAIPVSAVRAIGDCEETSITFSDKYSSPNFLRYRKLVSADFRIDDKDVPEAVMTTSCLFFPEFKMICCMEGDNFVARITDWKITSVFDRKQSSRKSWFRELARGLIHEQDHFNINELHARRLERIELPTGRGRGPSDAVTELTNKILLILDRAIKAANAEQVAYDARTDGSRNYSEQKKATTAIKARLKQAGIQL